MEKLKAALNANNLRDFLMAALEELPESKDDYQRMIDYCLSSSANHRVRAFIIGINEFKKCHDLTDKQRTCVKSTFDSLRALEMQSELPV